MGMQSPVPSALRVAVVGGGCSGFQYHMAFENQTNDTDEVMDFDGLKVAVDQMSSMYLDGVEIDYIETLEGAGFKFNNPNDKSTCGCGSWFSVESRKRVLGHKSSRLLRRESVPLRSLFSCSACSLSGLLRSAIPGM